MKWLFRIVLGVIMLGLPLVWWRHSARVVVPVAPAVRGTAVDAVTGTVKIIASLDLHIKTEVAARIREEPVQIGQMVKKGDVLAVLESTDLELTLAQRRIQLEAARQRAGLPYLQDADVAGLLSDVEALQLSANQGLTSQADLDRRLRELEKARTALSLEKIGRQEAVALLEQQVKQLEYHLSRMILRAPFDGQVLELLAFPGDWLWTGNAVVRLATVDRLVEMTLSEEDSFGVAAGQIATLHLASLPDQPFAASVAFLAPSAEAESKTRKVFLQVNAGAPTLAPGLTGEAVLVKAQRENTVIVPRRALIGDKLYVVRSAKVEVRRVQPGFLSLNKAEIRSGLEPGEMVALENQMILQSGDTIRPVVSE